ncbi:hypothetical protein DWQ65_09840 [Treponema phagedenis]|uniref:Uncharacterized protein n=2 Tax=Treponema phagedenis TaxID=162 RepID=A0AAE6M6T6_TREPH|nr:hypothetical protein [Treponema phagedenis]NVP23945.1 hypothetical protein [Treponema phagedenis]QEJ96614.1 hypothetical protein FUT82_00365 [Treponema phagedenis]QEJ99781.1 hypothetical protein FUT84_00355 [Treponema phagedenis]QEK02400.1 hypothetical protein FUT83_00360 [Treponema phagedenis]QEK08031.1 hypothetical protein FUT81_00360 [Treponema phagedenis]
MVFATDGKTQNRHGRRWFHYGKLPAVAPCRNLFSKNEYFPCFDRISFFHYTVPVYMLGLQNVISDIREQRRAIAAKAVSSLLSEGSAPLQSGQITMEVPPNPEMGDIGFPLFP